MPDVSYLPRFISERPLPFTECGTCVGIMGAEASSFGAVTTHGDTTPFSKDELVALIQKLRALAGITDATIGQSIGQVDRMLQAMWPQVPPMERPIGDTGGTRLQWPDFVDRLASGWYATVSGNPISVTNTASKLRTIQDNDDYAHSIGATNADPVAGTVVIQNPLGGWSYPNLTSKGFEVIPLAELRQFAWRTPDGAVYAGLWRKGAGVPLPAATVADLTKQLLATQAELANSRLELGRVNEVVAALRARNTLAVADVEALLAKLEAPVV